LTANPTAAPATDAGTIDIALPLDIEFASINETRFNSALRDALNRLGIDAATDINNVTLREGSTVANVEFVHSEHVATVERAILDGTFYLIYNTETLVVLQPTAVTFSPSGSPAGLNPTQSPSQPPTAGVDLSSAASENNDAEFSAVIIAIAVLFLAIVLMVVLIQRRRNARGRGVGAPIDPSLGPMMQVNDRTGQIDLGQSLRVSSSTDGETGYNQQLQLGNAYEMNQTSETDEFSEMIRGLQAVASGATATGASVDGSPLRLGPGSFATGAQVSKATSYTHSIDVDAEITAHSRLQLAGLSKYSFLQETQNATQSKAASAAPRTTAGKPQASLFSTEHGLLSRDDRIDVLVAAAHPASHIEPAAEMPFTRSPRSAPTPVQQADFEEQAFSFTISTSHQQPVQFAHAADNPAALYDMPLTENPTYGQPLNDQPLYDQPLTGDSES